jgi:hypothetical protein
MDDLTIHFERGRRVRCLGARDRHNTVAALMGRTGSRAVGGRA